MHNQPAVCNSSPTIKLSALPVLSRIVALNTGISGVDALLPANSELNFSQPIVLLYGKNNSGKSAMLKMLHDSILFSNYFDFYSCSWFMRELQSDEDLRKTLRAKDKPISTSNLANFLYKHRSDYALKKYLDAVESGLGSKVQSELKEQQERIQKLPANKSVGQLPITSRQFMKLISSLKEDSAINRFFYFSWQKSMPDSAAVTCLYQSPPVTHRYSRRTKGEHSMLGAFNRQYDGKQPVELKVDIASPFEVEMACIKGLDPSQISKSEITYQSDGAGAYSSWQLTKARIESILEKQILRSLTGETEEFDKDIKLVVLLDEPDVFMDPPTVASFCKEIKDYTDFYNGRLQFFVSTHNESMAIRLSEKAEYLNCVSKPAHITDSYDNIIWPSL